MFVLAKINKHLYNKTYFIFNIYDYKTIRMFYINICFLVMEISFPIALFIDFLSFFRGYASTWKQFKSGFFLHQKSSFAVL
jgi:hypothetical protein